MLAGTLREDLCSGWGFLEVSTSPLLVSQISYLKSVGVTWESYPLYLDKEITALASLCMCSSSYPCPVICLFRCVCASLTYKADSVPCLHGRSLGHSQGLVMFLRTSLLFSSSPAMFSRDFQPGVLLVWSYSYLPCVLAKSFIPSRQQFKSDLLEVRWLILGCCVFVTRIKQKIFCLFV